MFSSLKHTKIAAWLVERIGVACLYVVFYLIWLSRARRRFAQRQRVAGRSLSPGRYCLEMAALVRVLLLMSMASILRLK
jgi:uncharacterized membrane protein SirB2